MRLSVHAASAACTMRRSKYIVHVLAFSVPLSRVQLNHELDPVLPAGAASATHAEHSAQSGNQVM